MVETSARNIASVLAGPYGVTSSPSSLSSLSSSSSSSCSTSPSNQQNPKFFSSIRNHHQQHAANSAGNCLASNFLNGDQGNSFQDLTTTNNTNTNNNNNNTNNSSITNDVSLYNFQNNNLTSYLNQQEQTIYNNKLLSSTVTISKNSNTNNLSENELTSSSSLSSSPRDSFGSSSGSLNQRYSPLSFFIC